MTDEEKTDPSWPRVDKTLPPLWPGVRKEYLARPDQEKQILLLQHSALWGVKNIAPSPESPPAASPPPRM